MNYFNEKGTVPIVEHNKVNGGIAERYIAGMLTIALDARVSWATRTEDNSKVDLIAVINHPWLTNKVDVLFTQVKSGNTYCMLENNSLLVNKHKLKHLTKRNHNTLVVWSLVDKDETYWFFIKANTSYFRLSYNTIGHRLCPASRFDVIRMLTSASLKDGGRGLIFSTSLPTRSCELNHFRSLRKKAKLYYNFLKRCPVFNPLFGRVEFTRLGWRHITRESRLNEYKVASFEILAIVNNLLGKSPSKHYALDLSLQEDENDICRITEYLLEFENVYCHHIPSRLTYRVSVYVKLLEFVAYRKNWRQQPNASVQRRVLFKSVYYKKSS